MPAKRVPAAPAKPAPKPKAGGRASAQAVAPPTPEPVKAAPKGKAAAGKAAPAARGKAKQPAPPPAKAPTIGAKQLADGFADRHQIPRKQARAMVDDLLGALAGHVRAGDKLRLDGLGVLQARRRSARTGRNPATGESIQVAASTKIVFRPAKELKQAVLGED